MQNVDKIELDAEHVWALKHRLSGHRSKVLCLALSPDGLCCASGSEDGVVKIWDLGAYLENDDDDDEVDGEGGFPRYQRVVVYCKYCIRTDLFCTNIQTNPMSRVFE